MRQLLCHCNEYTLLSPEYRWCTRLYECGIQPSKILLDWAILQEEMVDICTCMHPPAVIIFPLASTGDMLKSSEGAETFCNVTTRGLMITQNWAELKDCIVTFKYLSWWGNHRAKMLNILWYMCQDMKLGFTLMHSGSTTATASRKLLMCCLRSS